MPKARAKRQQDDPIDLADAHGRPSSANFASARAAYTHLEGRGYALVKSANWLPPASIVAPTKIDLEAAWLLTHAADYGHIIKLRSCPFCGGRADAHSPIGVECTDCGATANDVDAWQKRV